MERIAFVSDISRPDEKRSYIWHNFRVKMRVFCTKMSKAKRQSRVEPKCFLSVDPRSLPKMVARGRGGRLFAWMEEVFCFRSFC